nr:putative reverse transcriptase domain-containing protein [Tanacetum cinerariifolium]
MARLQFFDYHNMVAILEKGKFNSDFHPIVDFIAASPLKYALTVKPTIFVSYIRQFWSTTRIETTDEGTHILATVIGIQRTASESSLRRNLKLRDEDCIVSIPDMELFENLTLMGVQVLEDREGVAAKQSGDDAPIKGRSINKGEAAAERISNDLEDVVRVLTSMDATTVLAGGIDVPTGSGSIPTAEKQEKKDMRMNEQIARDAEVARIHTEKEIQGMIDSLDRSNETTAKYLQEYQEFALELTLEKRIELISDLVKYQEHYSKVEDFIPMGSKEEAERLKRKGLNLEQEHLVPVEDVYVQALQVKHPIIDWKVHTEGQRSYWQIIRLGGSSACYQFFVDLLKQLDSEDLNQLWALVKEYLSIRPSTSEKEMELWVELKRMYEPDPKDQLWNVTHNFMHAHVEWKLYDLSGVHHLTAKDKEIFMLVEKDYPLIKGLALVMISYKLQVENYSQMTEDLIRKIYNITNTLRVIERVGSIAYKLELLEELSRVYNTFHVSNLKMCYANKPLAVPLDGLHFDDKIQFVEEPIEIMDHKVKCLRNSRVLIVKARWNSRRGLKFTWEREDQFKKKFSVTMMSDSEDSTVTYTTVSSPYEGRSGDVSPGVDGPPKMSEDPYAYVVAAFEALPPPDYVPGLEEPEQAPPSPVYIPYVPEPVYLEYIPSEDDVFPAEEQPLPATATPTTYSPRYILESDSDEDPEDDDDEHPEKDPANYPTDHDDDDEEEEHPASADSIPPPPALHPRDVAEEVALTTLKGVNTRVTELAAVQEQDTRDIYRVMEDTQGRQTEIFQRVEALVDDRQYHYETGRLIDQEDRFSREAWAHSMGLGSAIHFELQGYMTHTWLQDHRIDA